MKLPTRSLFAAALLVPMTMGATAYAQSPAPVMTSLETAGADTYTPRFSKWYETILPGQGLDISLPAGHVLMIDGEAWTPSWRAPDSRRGERASACRAECLDLLRSAVAPPASA